MARIVCNTGPLIALERIDQLALLQAVFGQVLMDEHKGRKVARQVYGLRTLGTVRVLLEAKERGSIDAIGAPLALMREQGYRIHDDIVRAALVQAGEQPPRP
ncbi:DUF3368 domain-containing protein [Lamprobacter modestohalophilus]|uniref:DUF3368 domain-containing protein n=1 Tax=Lamprobacter modestohalophilus TaxID=1064514 RepID=UPI002ADEC6CB|nr:DUF3368 domain-containing protein [Lamprobacter modestohalophilus]MEA1051582.1 DUF3368 domain-containing protein [Lamprobacter modestohalophilus]